ncbi:MAG: phospholipase A [Nitrospirae bacterium]|nr:phospholipase A [Nitrospirota bacterium]
MRKIDIIFIALSIILIAAATKAEDIPENKAADADIKSVKNDTQEKDRLNPYKPTYFMLQWGTPDPRDKKQLYTKFQFNTKKELPIRNLSQKVPIPEYLHLYIAYTYRALWSITEESAPFKDNSHNPEAFIDIDNKHLLKIGQIGLEHESNGKGKEDSRSWNRAYWEPRLVYHRPEGRILGFDTLSVHLRGWIKFRELQSDNPDILDYYGNGEIALKLYGDKNLFTVSARKGLKKSYGNIQIEYMYRIFENFCIYAQFWDGYGESLLDYNRRSTRYGVGMALTY